MISILFLVVSSLLVASLLPFLFPGTIMNALGASLNMLLGTALVSMFGIGSSTLVSPSLGGHTLTLQGVMVAYGPLLLLLLLGWRGR